LLFLLMSYYFFSSLLPLTPSFFHAMNTHAMNTHAMNTHAMNTHAMNTHAMNTLVVTKIFLVLVLFLSAACGYGQMLNFQKVDSILNANARRLNNRYVVMIQHNGRLVYYKALGADSLTTGQIASATKTFSAAVLLRLAQEGKLRLDDSIATYKPQATSFGKGSCTIRQNFSHTAGWTGNTSYHETNRFPLQEAADSIIRFDRFSYRPGEAFRYTGVSMHVAGAIAELASGETWDNLFRTRIKNPLGLDSTTFCLGGTINPRIAGGICSNPRDMMRFGEFIRTNGKNERGAQVLDRVWMEEFWKDQTNKAPQRASPYPDSPTTNNPYKADTIYYGFGCWLDIYNPTTKYQEQISAVGAFGARLWVNRCHNVVGIFFTLPPSLNGTVEPVAFDVMDAVRAVTPYTCTTTTDVAATDVNLDTSNAVVLSPSPVSDVLTVTFRNAPLHHSSLVTIVDMMGQTVLQQSLSGSAGTLSLAGLSNGVYILKLQNTSLQFGQRNDEQISIHKLIVMR
jgi:CubicO group peptidase (beta-lactamase class C family)